MKVYTDVIIKQGSRAIEWRKVLDIADSLKLNKGQVSILDNKNNVFG